ncbi:MAG: 4-aminobutyrate aminotransferase [Planctomycetes bacterium RBG_16_59_8]|nr:MAG: 4-aminobutyrate aminotransferase [Planctomycetes bacterium RBG_16_59_8]
MSAFHPKIVVGPPGPKARKVIGKDRKFISPSYTRAYPLVIERGEGMFVEDIDGNRFLDFTGGVAVNTTGHAHPEIVRTIAEQSSKFIHMAGTDFYYRLQSDLAEKLSEITPGKFPKMSFLVNSGTEAVEAALKLARYVTGRPRFLAFLGGFHGRTMGALGLTASKAIQRRGFSPLLSEVTHIPYPYCYRCPFNMKPETCKIDCLRYAEEWIFAKVAPPEDIAAIIVEPIQGEGGYVVPPKSYFRTLRALCDRYGILMIDDEVQAGLGRTGKMFAIEHWGITPDIMCIAKGIASGLPLGAMVGRADLFTWPSGAHANTFGGNPVACAAALKTIEMIQGGLMKNAVDTGRYLHHKLDNLARRSPAIGDHRGIGLMQGIEIVADRKTKKKAPALRGKIVQDCFSHGLLLLGCGESSIRFSPSLIVGKGHVDAAVAILGGAIRRCS